MGFTLYRSPSEENCCLNQVKTGCFGSKPMTPIIKSISIKKQVPNKNTHQNQFKIKRGYLLGQPLFYCPDKTEIQLKMRHCFTRSRFLQNDVSSK